MKTPLLQDDDPQDFSKARRLFEDLNLRRGYEEYEAATSGIVAEFLRLRSRKLVSLARPGSGEPDIDELVDFHSVRDLCQGKTFGVHIPECEITIIVGGRYREEALQREQTLNSAAFLKTNNEPRKGLNVFSRLFRRESRPVLLDLREAVHAPLPDPQLGADLYDKVGLAEAKRIFSSEQCRKLIYEALTNAGPRIGDQLWTLIQSRTFIPLGANSDHSKTKQFQIAEVQAGATALAFVLIVLLELGREAFRPLV